MVDTFRGKSSHVKTLTDGKKNRKAPLFPLPMIYIVPEILHRKLRSTTLV